VFLVLAGLESDLSGLGPDTGEIAAILAVALSGKLAGARLPASPPPATAAAGVDVGSVPGFDEAPADLEDSPVPA
jgi:hypothetical protein